MNSLFDQIANIFGAMPLSQKLVMAFILILAGFGFFGLYMYGQKTMYQPLYGNLSAEDASTIVEKLREQKVPFQIEGSGSLILVPSDKVYDLRLSLASWGLPKGGGLGLKYLTRPISVPLNLSRNSIISGPSRENLPEPSRSSVKWMMPG